MIKSVVFRKRDNTWHINYECRSRVVKEGQTVPKTAREFVVNNSDNCRVNDEFIIWENK